MNFRKKTVTKIRWRDFRILRKRLYTHVYTLSNEIGPRNLQQYSALNKAREYIAEQMTLHSSNLFNQQYHYNKKPINNLIIEKVGQKLPDEIIVIGAHYDTVIESPGADDNATGIACLLELIRLLHNYNNQRTLRFVAFTLEEPPFFGTEQMGSNVYARSCKEKGENIVGMIALEMLGYYTEKRRSQNYPLPDMGGQYSDRGNFIAVVTNDQYGQLAIDFAEKIKEVSLIKAKTIISNFHIHGIDLSDHSSFWKYNYPAIMITDTAFYRNPDYHEVSDTIDTLNFKYFTRAVYALGYALKRLDQQDMI
ncbi:MAG: M28 family peptidase [bacterium]|nr:MAG: M28 family peptidase [bacterium]